MGFSLLQSLNFYSLYNSEPQIHNRDVIF